MAKDVFLIGAKSIGQYGGYESFVKKMIEYSEKEKSVNYHIACKANGEGKMDLNLLEGVTIVNDHEFIYRNAHGFLIKVNEKLKSAQAIYYDLISIKTVVDYIRKNSINDFVIFIMACRIGPFFNVIVKQIHNLGGKVYINPDGHEWLRTKWSPLVRKYWKTSERLMIKRSDLIICDSKNIEKYIKSEYEKYNPKTLYIAYGSETNKSLLKDNDKKYVDWIKKNNINDGFITVIGRCVPENNFEAIIKEYMSSKTERDLVIVSTKNDEFFNELDNIYHFTKDSRIKIVGAIYDQELLKKIREKSYAYIHGHSVGGTNPSLLEALGSTSINLLYDVCFNREVAEDSALYWNLENGSLSSLIDEIENFDEAKIKDYSSKAKKRINDNYSWNLITSLYIEAFIS